MNSGSGGGHVEEQEYQYALVDDGQCAVHDMVE